MSIFVFIGLKDYSEFYKTNIIICRILLIIRAILRLIIDGWMFTKFIDNFFFFLRRKAGQIENSTGYSKSNNLKIKIICVWTMILTFLRAIVSLSVTFIYGMYFWQINEEVISETLNFSYYFFLRTFYYFTDLLTIITLIYLFYK
jgi:hypothetical protein